MTEPSGSRWVVPGSTDSRSRAEHPPWRRSAIAGLAVAVALVGAVGVAVATAHTGSDGHADSGMEAAMAGGHHRKAHAGAPPRPGVEPSGGEP